MLKRLLVIVICWSSVSYGQDNSVNVISATGFAGGHLSGAKLEKESTQWLGRPGFGTRVGAGFQFRFGRGLMLDVEGGYEINYYMYKHTELLLTLGYQAPFAGIRASYMFPIRESKFRYWYCSAAGSYIFTGNASLTDGEFDYTYTIQLAPGGVISVMPEAGLYNFLGDNMGISYGIIFRYSWQNTITNTMQKLPELNPATSSSNGNYIGIIIRYYHPLKVLKRKRGGGDTGPTGRVRI